jgi:hypothetical protein
MKKLVLVFACLISIVSFGCGSSSDSPRESIGHFGLNHESGMDMTGMVVVTTELGVTLHVPEALFEEPGFEEMLTEVDVSVLPFYTEITEIVGRENFIENIRAIHFHEMTEHDEDLRATYVGDGVISACYHKNTPHLFCLSEALDDLARDVYPDLNEAVYFNAAINSRFALFHMYGAAVD